MGVLIPIPSTEIIKNPNPNEENREIPSIDVFTNTDPNLLFHSKIPVQRSPIPSSQFFKGKSQFPIHPSLLRYNRVLHFPLRKSMFHEKWLIWHPIFLKKCLSKWFQSKTMPFWGFALFWYLRPSLLIPVQGFVIFCFGYFADGTSILYLVKQKHKLPSFMRCRPNMRRRLQGNETGQHNSIERTSR